MEETGGETEGWPIVPEQVAFLNHSQGRGRAPGWLWMEGNPSKMAGQMVSLGTVSPAAEKGRQSLSTSSFSSMVNLRPIQAEFKAIYMVVSELNWMLYLHPHG